MKCIKELIDLLRNDWSQPREAVHRGQRCPFLLECNFGPSITCDYEGVRGHLPPDLAEFWQIASHASLFKDQQYGQWGIDLLSLEDALEETKIQIGLRPVDYLESDLVVGRFLGDSELLVVRCDGKASDFGFIMVALPLYSRSAWQVAAKTLGEFLYRLTISDGDKFWER